MRQIALWSGLLGPLMLALIIGTLTFVEYDFLRSLRWHPLYAPTTDWPSGLALGTHGWIMISAFVGSGSLLFIFALGTQPMLQSKLGTALLLIASLALMMLGFKTDPTYIPTPRTWHGALHDLAFVLLGLSLLPAMLVLGWQLRFKWRGYARYTLLTAFIIIPAFWLKGIFFYLFLGGILMWFEVTALRLYFARHD